MDEKFITPLIEKNQPVAIGKLGSSELRAVTAIRNNNPLSKMDTHDIFVGAGVFPPVGNSLSEFFSEYVNAIGGMDVLARWLGDNETKVIEEYCPAASSVALRSLEPFYWDDPWSKHLAGKNVLVISPFAESIKSQYSKRELLWENENVLPEFNLKTIKCPLSWYCQEDKPGGSWLTVLDDLEHEMDSNEHYDFCLVGAGAWSLPLVVYAKNLGATAIHLGGGLQILFGIKGKRWDNHEVISTFYNEHWVRPSKEETPELSTLVENGCYW